MQKKIKQLLFILIIANLTACSLAIESFSNNLNNSVRTNNDIETIKQGLPAYIVLLNSLIESDPENEETLKSSAELLNSYAGLISIDLEMNEKIPEYQRVKLIKQRNILVNQSLNNAQKAICLYDDVYCNISQVKYQYLVDKLTDVDEDDIEYLYALAVSWLSWLQLNSDDWNNTAKIPHIKLLFETIVKIDDNWKQGTTFMYLGVMNSLVPESYGGKPEIAKTQFIKAYEKSSRKNLMAKVLYAEYYARLIYDEKLHNQLIEEVISTEIVKDEFLLMNTIAIEKAILLKNSAKDYF